MEGKTGKSGPRLGRTVRSRFAQNRGKRSEGVLIHSTVGNSSIDGDQDEGERVTYSLGKQSRWLLPEVIKTHTDEFDGEVVLVERYKSKGSRKFSRSKIYSVFSSNKNITNNTSQKPKRKRSRARDFPQDVEKEEIKTRYDVEYPLPAGCWSKGIKKPVAYNHGKRKKHSFTNLTFEDDFEDPTDTENSEIEDEEDLINCCDRASSLDLCLFVNHDQTFQAKGTSKSGRSVEHEECKLVPPVKCVFFESESEMHEAHLNFLEQIRAGSSLLDTKHQTRNNVPSNANKRKGHRHGKTRNPNSVSPEESVVLVGRSPHPVEPVHPDIDEGVVIRLRKQEVAGEALAQQWGDMHKEGASYPRSFLLNITPFLSISNCKEVFIVFRVFEDSAYVNAGEVRVLVNLAICNDKNNGSRIARDFISQIQARDAEQEIWTLEDISSVACFCVQEEELDGTNGSVDHREPRPPRMSLNVFTKLFGLKSKAYSSQGAKQEVKEQFTVVGGFGKGSTVAPSAQIVKQQHECEICFKEIVQDKATVVSNCFISLNACGHTFCDDCWRAHLKTQIHLGHTDLKCPGHDCTTTVDDVTLMSLVPSWYCRHLIKRLNTILEISPEWKWCPADQCKLVVKATTPPGPSVSCNELVSSVKPVPVVCVCGTMWCFKCQEDAHWPATCEEAQVFRQKNTSYARLVTSIAKKSSLVTSVQVKNCPSCHYPVEKGLGCDHMTCILCFNEFCWLCLGKWSRSHQCYRHVNLRKVNLPTTLVNIMSYEHVAVTSRVARTSFLICKIHRKLDKIAKEIQLFSKCFPLKKPEQESSKVEKQLNLLSENNASHSLKEMFNFKFQALLVLEGTAIKLAFSKEHEPYSKRLAMEFSRLLFIVQRMDEILKDMSLCLKAKECLCKLKHFVKCGKKCIHFIGKYTNQITITNW